MALDQFCGGEGVSGERRCPVPMTSWRLRLPLSDGLFPGPASLMPLECLWPGTRLFPSGGRQGGAGAPVLPANGSRAPECAAGIVELFRNAGLERLRSGRGRCPVAAAAAATASSPPPPRAGLGGPALCSLPGCRGFRQPGKRENLGQKAAL